MSCLIRNGKFYTPNGEESVLYKELENKVGEEEATQLFLLSNTPTFLKNVPKGKQVFKINNTSIHFKDRILPNGKKTGQIELELIQTSQSERGKGEAKKAIKEFLNYTDSLGKEVYLFASPRDKQTSEDKLIKFYESVGFRSIDRFLPQEMVRKSKKIKPNIDIQKPTSDSFYSNGEVKAEIVLNYAQNNFSNTTPLSTVEKSELINLNVEGIETSEDLYSKLSDMFFENGLFKPNPRKMKSFYSEVEISKIMTSVSEQAKIKETLEKLRHTEEFDLVSIPFEKQFLIKTLDTNILGKFKTNNPLQEKQQYIKDNVGEEIENPLTPLDEYSRIPVIDEQGNPVQNKLIYDNAVKVIDDSEVIRGVNAVINAHPSVDTTKVQKKISKRLLNFGLDVSNLNRADYNILLDFINTPTEENIQRLETALGFEPTLKEEVLKIEPKNRSYAYLKTVKTEEELFNELSLVKTNTPNVYHRVNKISEEEMRDIQDNQDLSVPEYQLYKDYYNYDVVNETVNEVGIDAVNNTEYLTDEFVADFASEKLKQPGNEFYSLFKIDEDGIKLVSEDVITLEKVKSYLKDGIKYSKELQDYSSISKNMPNFKDRVSNIKTKENKRIEAVNNKNSVTTPSSVVSIVDDTTIKALNETSEFLRIGDSIYEQVSQGFYKKLNFTENANYFTTEVEAPNYSTEEIKQLQTSESKIPNLISKELEEENFNCL